MNSGNERHKIHSTPQGIRHTSTLKTGKDNKYRRINITKIRSVRQGENTVAHCVLEVKSQICVRQETC